MDDKIDREALREAVNKTAEATRTDPNFDLEGVVRRASQAYWDKKLSGGSLEEAHKAAVDSAKIKPKEEYKPTEELVSYYTKCFFVGSVFFFGIDRAIFCSRLYDYLFGSIYRQVARRHLSNFPFEISAAVAWRATYFNLDKTSQSLFENGNLSPDVMYFLGVGDRKGKKVKKFIDLFKSEILRAAKIGAIEGSWGKLVLLNGEPIVLISEKLQSSGITKEFTTRKPADIIGGFHSL